MKFLADMGISLRTVSWLRDTGYDVVHLRDEGLQRLHDEEILIKTRIEGRILLTIDLDFARLLALSGEILPSVILFRLGNENYQEINERLTEVLSQCQQDLEAGEIVYVNTDAFRVRKLPIMSKVYPLVPLGEVLTRHKNEINIQEIDTYTRITIRMNG